MIALITPTGGRAQQIQLCAKYMKGQSYKGKVLWIIVDDCTPTTIDFIPQEFKDNWEIVKIYPKPTWRPGQNTQSRNLQAGIEELKKHTDIETVFIIEDDDWYSQNYLVLMNQKLKGFDVTGEIHTMYYNTNIFASQRMHNTKHSSLFQTAFKYALIFTFEKALSMQKFIDIAFFSLCKNVNLFSGLDLAVGIKGLPGRQGIGSGHRVSTFKSSQKHLLQRILELKKLIGIDYLNYLPNGTE